MLLELASGATLQSHSNMSSAPPRSADIAPLKRWRRFVPAWLRSLIWPDFAEHYDAFLSYSWKSDGEIAPVIHSVLQRFLCPWYKLRAKTIFRDLSYMPAGSSLEAELLDRIDKSTHLIVLASPGAARSEFMQREARHWFGQDRQGQVLILVTDGSYKTWGEIERSFFPEPFEITSGVIRCSHSYRIVAPRF